MLTSFSYLKTKTCLWPLLNTVALNVKQIWTISSIAFWKVQMVICVFSQHEHFAYGELEIL